MRPGGMRATWTMPGAARGARRATACVALLLAWAAPARGATDVEQPVPPDLRLRDLAIEHGPEGYRVVVEGGPALSGEQFLETLHARQEARRARGWLFRVLNITAPAGIAWVTLGLLGQLLFTGRMVVQWLASEARRRSVVPVAFWWMSLVGASMLLAYFLWRKDAVGVLGQAVGWLIYVRNLWLIHAGRA